MPIGEDALGGYTFSVEIDGVDVAQFKEVSGISAEITTIEHRENKKGGLPVMKKLPGARKYGDLTLKRGKTNSKALWDWIKTVQQGDIDNARKNGSIVLFDYPSMGASKEVGRFNFLNAWPSKVTVGSLQSGGSEILVEECTITHEGIAPA